MCPGTAVGENHPGATSKNGRPSVCISRHSAQKKAEKSPVIKKHPGTMAGMFLLLLKGQQRVKR
jgi:hypothetical protein